MVSSMAKISESYKASSAASMLPMGNSLANIKSFSMIRQKKGSQPFLIDVLSEMEEDLNDMVAMNAQSVPEGLTSIRTCESNEKCISTC